MREAFLISGGGRLNSKECICRTAVRLGESDFVDVGYRQSDVLGLAKRNGMKPSDNSSARKHEEVKKGRRLDS